MEFVNRTPYPARVFHGRRDLGVQRFSVVVRVTLQLQDSGALTAVDPRNATPLWPAAMPTPWGVFPSDDTHDRRGCDFIVLGSVVSQYAVTECVAHARVGTFATQIVAVGDRVWERSGRQLQPGAARPFVEMPLDWSRAFGGRADPAYEHTDHPLNPAGRGYYATAELALGRALPNLESPSHRVRSWDDQPTPTSWGPVANASVWQALEWLAQRRARGGTVPITHADGEAMTRSLYPAASSPAMVLPGPRAGDLVEVTGVSRAPMRFRVPDLGLAVRAVVGANEIASPFALGGLWLMAPARLVVVTLRASFQHQRQVSDERSVTVEQVAPLR